MMDGRYENGKQEMATVCKLLGQCLKAKQRYFGKKGLL